MSWAGVFLKDLRSWHSALGLCELRAHRLRPPIPRSSLVDPPRFCGLPRVRGRTQRVQCFFALFSWSSVQRMKGGQPRCVYTRFLLLQFAQHLGASRCRTHTIHAVLTPQSSGHIQLTYGISAGVVLSTLHMARTGCSTQKQFRRTNHSKS